MRVNSICLYNNEDLWIIEEFLNIENINLALKICDTFYDDKSQWSNPDWTDLRYIHKKETVEWKELEEIFKSGEVYKNLKGILGNNLVFGTMDLWCDLPGYGPLAPHCENTGTIQGQIYLTRNKTTEFKMHGTSVHTMEKKLLFTLPYRNNLAWVFKQCQQVMHGRELDVPKNLERFSLIFWYQ